MTYELLICFFIGFVVGSLSRKKNLTLEEQEKIYMKKEMEYLIEIEYYKELCKWHAERKQNGNKEN